MIDFSKFEEFEWDLGNLDKNKVKHSVSTEECEQVFHNKPLKYFSDPGHSDKEERFLAYGQTDRGRGLVVVFTVRKNKIRIISARDQNRKEEREYEKET